jgi:hypothetical protein
MKMVPDTMTGHINFNVSGMNNVQKAIFCAYQGTNNIVSVGVMFSDGTIEFM